MEPWVTMIDNNPHSPSKGKPCIFHGSEFIAEVRDIQTAEQICRMRNHLLGMDDSGRYK